MFGPNCNGYPALNTPTIAGDLQDFIGGMAIYGSLAQINTATSINGVYLSSGQLVFYGSYMNLAGPVWGPFQLAVNGGTLSYPTGAGAAVANFLQTAATPFKMNGIANACSHSAASPDVVSCGISITAAHLDAAQGAAGFGGNAVAQQGIGSITNTGQL